MGSTLEGNNLRSQELTLIDKKRQTENGRIASHSSEGVHIHLQCIFMAESTKSQES